jgi:hypothetical protein
MAASEDKHLADTLPCLASTSKLDRGYSAAGRTQTLGRNDTSATPMSDLLRGGIP